MKTNSIDEQRQSKFELLRIISMILIITYHIEYHTIDVLQLPGVFSGDFFAINLIIPQVIRTFGSIGNGLFILISGYFLVSKKENINLYCISKKIILQFAFISIILVIVSLVICKTLPNKNISFHSILEFNDYTWFLGYYFIIIVLAKLFLNKFLNNQDVKKYFTFVVSLFAIVSFYWSGSLLDKMANGLRTLGIGIVLYSLGGGIRLFQPLKNVRTYIFFVLIFISYCLILISFYGNTKMNEKADAFISLGNYTSVIIVITVSIFELFNRLQIKNSSFINNIAKSSFMVYLFHDNKVIYDIWNLTDWVLLLKNSPTLFIIKITIWAIITYLLGTILYVVYKIIFKYLLSHRRLYLK